MSDREPFEKHCEGLLGSPVERNHGVYRNGSVQAAWNGWQAARDHYAPKLTFKEAIEKAGDAVEKLVSRGCFPGDSEFDYALEVSAAAFRAAGVRFKEEA